MVKFYLWGGQIFRLTDSNVITFSLPFQSNFCRRNHEQKRYLIWPTDAEKLRPHENASTEQTTVSFLSRNPNFVQLLLSMKENDHVIYVFVFLSILINGKNSI